MATKITILKLRRKEEGNINQELQWLGNSLGLFNLRDKDSSCFRVFITLVKNAKRERTATSDDIAEQLHLSRGTVVHHLTKLMDTGIVVRIKGGYILREQHLLNIVKDIKVDMENIFRELQEVAKDIDERIN
ncbi:MAG: ArsR family transcriptional regulator [archaeon]|nr:ArsR family transcriptional regulator [archaeon]